MDEIGARVGLKGVSIQKIKQRHKWKERRAKLAEIHLDSGGKLLQSEKVLVKTQEREMGRELIALGIEKLKLLKNQDVSLKDVLAAIKLGDELTRLSLGMPMNPVEVNVTHDLSAELTAAINKVYGNLDVSDKVNVKAQLNAPIEAEVVTDEPKA